MYSIVGDDSSPFVIDATSGEIRINGQLPSTIDGDQINVSYAT